MDAALIPHSRLRDLSVGEFLSHVFAWVWSQLHGEDRQAFELSLLPDEVVIPPAHQLPPGLQGQRPPDWWTGGTAPGR